MRCILTSGSKKQQGQRTYRRVLSFLTPFGLKICALLRANRLISNVGSSPPTINNFGLLISSSGVILCICNVAFHCPLVSCFCAKITQYAQNGRNLYKMEGDFRKSAMTVSIPSNTLEKFTTFGDLLRFLRRRVGLTQTELAS